MPIAGDFTKMYRGFTRVAGIDVHRDFLAVSVVDRLKGVLKSMDVANKEANILKLAQYFKKANVQAVVFEATGIYTERLEKYLIGAWQAFKINPADVTNHDGRKTDRRDALRLAQLLLGGIIGKQDAPVQGSIVLDEMCLRLRLLTRKYEIASKDAARAATRLVNLVYQLELDFHWLCEYILTINGQLLLFVIVSQFSFEKWVNDLKKARETATTRVEKNASTRCLTRITKHTSLAKQALTTACQRAQRYGLLVPLQESLHALLFARQQKTSYFQAVQHVVTHHPSLSHTVDRIISISGVGFLNSAIIAAETGDFTRFANERKYISWFGLNPRTSHSANRKRYGRISKRGNRHIRRVLYQNVTALLRDKHHPLRAFYYRIRHRKGKNSGNIVRTATMRKLACLIFLLVTRDEPYRGRSPPSKKWKGVSARVLPKQYVNRLSRLLDELTFDFPGSFHSFYHWLNQGSLPVSSS